MRLFLVIGLMFSPIAAAMAFLITFREYTRHFTARRRPLLYALRAAAFAFVVFMTISLLAGYVWIRFVVGS